MYLTSIYQSVTAQPYTCQRHPPSCTACPICLMYASCVQGHCMHPSMSGWPHALLYAAWTMPVPALGASLQSRTRKAHCAPTYLKLLNLALLLVVIIHLLHALLLLPPNLTHTRESRSQLVRAVHACCIVGVHQHSRLVHAVASMCTHHALTLQGAVATVAPCMFATVLLANAPHDTCGSLHCLRQLCCS